MPQPIAMHRNPRSWIVTVGRERLLVILEDRPYRASEVARLVADHAAVAVSEATGSVCRATVREARFWAPPAADR